MTKIEIIAVLGRLSPEGLAEVRAALDRTSVDKGSSGPRIYSPHLGNPAQKRDFIKQISELSPSGPRESP